MDAIDAFCQECGLALREGQHKITRWPGLAGADHVKYGRVTYDGVVCGQHDGPVYELEAKQRAKDWKAALVAGVK
jgi:hypothetical protein